MPETFTDPATGRRYTIDPVTGESRWLDYVPPQRPAADDARAQAKAAKAYAKARRPWWKKKRIILPGILGVIVIGAAVGGSKSDGTSPGIQPVAKSAAKIAVEQVSARTIADAFDANKVSATQQWKGHRVTFTSKVTNVDNDSVTLDGNATKEFSLTQFSCKLRDSSQAAKVTNDKQATVEGTITGQDFGAIGLDECVIG